MSISSTNIIPVEQFKLGWKVKDTLIDVQLMNKPVKEKNNGKKSKNR